jgi:hypothetical protein
LPQCAVKTGSVAACTEGSTRSPADKERPDTTIATAIASEDAYLSQAINTAGRSHGKEGHSSTVHEQRLLVSSRDH